MIRDIITDEQILSIPSANFDFRSKQDNEDLKDFIDTVVAHKDDCVGLAAVQIGIHTRVIAYLDNKSKSFQLMFNPVISKKSKSTWTETEGCLSQPGKEVAVSRPYSITVIYQDIKGKTVRKQCGGWTARVIQHEVDHLRGKLL